MRREGNIVDMWVDRVWVREVNSSDARVRIVGSGSCMRGSVSSRDYCGSIETGPTAMGCDITNLTSVHPV
jgi:hypothetical protein